ncbi:Hypothetical protein CINCED_3A012147 [Cinara cedri]|uniref:Uncharacterized protein n=1 Tax=Cinara cedri TaxID=506608 RepID=A0A5E4N2G7_9HEMI|nr:Hypothetical protein CINCED_3A012147 [Cinara cedri]
MPLEDQYRLHPFASLCGLPIAKSSQSQLWPIVESVLGFNNVFIIGIYHGH